VAGEILNTFVRPRSYNTTVIRTVSVSSHQLSVSAGKSISLSATSHWFASAQPLSYASQKKPKKQ
jgi:hypothetical protein